MNRSRVRTARPTAKLQAGRTDWFRMVRNAAPGVDEVHIYDEIGYWGVTAQDFVDQLGQLDSPALDIHINSPGGDVFDGIAIHTAISNRAGKTTVYVDGLAASAASFIAMAGDEIVMAKAAQMMIHDAMGLAIGNAADMQRMVEDLSRISDVIAGIYADRAGEDVAHWRGLMLAETWFNGAEAVAAGLADRVAGAEPDDAPVENSFDLSVFKYSARADAPAPPAVQESEPTLDLDPEMFRAAFQRG